MNYFKSITIALLAISFNPCGLAQDLSHRKTKNEMLMFRLRSILKVKIFLGNPKKSDPVSAGFFISKNGHFILPHHIEKHLKAGSRIRIEDYKGNLIKDISKGSCLSNSSVDACIYKANGYKVAGYIPLSTRRRMTTGSTYRIYGYGHCKSDNHLLDLGATFYKKGETPTYLNISNSSGDDSVYLKNNDILIIDGTHCKKDSGAPLFTKGGELIGMLSQLIHGQNEKGINFKVFIGMPVTSLMKVGRNSTPFKRVPASQIVKDFPKVRMADPFGAFKGQK